MQEKVQPSVADLLLHWSRIHDLMILGEHHAETIRIASQLIDQLHKLLEGKPRSCFQRSLRPRRVTFNVPDLESEATFNPLAIVPEFPNYSPSSPSYTAPEDY